MKRGRNTFKPQPKPSRGFTRPEPNVKYLNEDLEI
jgi:hypothetical protein